MNATRQIATLMTPDERRTEAFTLVDEIRDAIAAGRSFTSPFASSFFVDMRDNLKAGPHARISVAQLGWLRKIRDHMKGKKK